MCLTFLEKCLPMLTRSEIRTKYIPFIVKNFSNANQKIKIQMLEILVYILVKIPDYQSRCLIHHFVNEDLAKSKSIYNRKLFIVFCSLICPKISKKYFKQVFAFSFLKIIEEKKKDIAITFAKHVVEVRKKIDDIVSTSKIENTLNSMKNVFYKDELI